MELRAVRRAIRDCDILLSGGGSLLQDVTSLRSLAYYVLIMRMARVARKPYMLYAQGIGPLRRRVARALVGGAARRAAAITVRDEASARLLDRLGVGRAAVNVTADPAFALDPPARGDEHSRTEVDAGARGVVGLCPRPWPGLNVVGEFADAAAALRNRGFEIVWLPMQGKQDTGIAEAAASASGVGTLCDTQGEPGRALAAVARLDLLVAMRLHALAFGAMCSTPLVAVAYDPKVDALMDSLECRDTTVAVAEATGDALCELAERAIARPDASVRRTKDAVGRLRESALTNVDIAARAAGGCATCPAA
jgi:polysaccharide pyruvyl transferase CsaB